MEDASITITPADMKEMVELLLEENARLRRGNLEAHVVLRRTHEEVVHLRAVVEAISSQGEFLAAQWVEPAETDPQDAATAPNDGSAAPEVPEFSQESLDGLAAPA